MATAVTACARWGLKARYVGKIGDDYAATLQVHEMLKSGIEAHWIKVPHCQSQSSFIFVDEESGERTVLWKRDSAPRTAASEIQQEWVTRGQAAARRRSRLSGSHPGCPVGPISSDSSYSRHRQPLPRSGSIIQ